MDHFVYIAATGAEEFMYAQAVNANNLANSSTAGFRADMVMAQSVYLSGGGLDSRTYANSERTGIDFSEGAVNMTGRALDVALNGEGWIAVQAADGSEALSRRGDLRVGPLGVLIDGAGRQIVGNSGPIALPPYSEIEIGRDGTVSIVPLGEGPSTLAVVDRIKLVNPDATLLEKGSDGLIAMRNGENSVADAGITLTPGSLESSNVNSVASMVQMIEQARQFEQHVKMMKTAEQMDQSSAQLMSLT